jgi:putative salt-induced outer membrane protein
MIQNWIALAALAGTLGVSAALADDAPPPAPPQGWSGKGQAGVVLSRGNSDTDTANAKLDLSDTIGDWKHTVHFEGLYGRSSGITQAERWDAQLQSDYQFSPRMFAFGALHYLDDQFSGFQYQADITTGLGYKVLTTDSDKLTVQVGAGYRRLRPETIVTDSNGEVIQRVPLEPEGSAVATAGIDYDHDFNASTKITDKFTVAAGSGNTELQDDLALVVSMSKKLALSAGFTLLENTQPPAGLKKVSTLTTLNLVYSFNQP